MNTQFIRDEVERRIADRLPGVLLEKGITVHAKKAFRLGCNCDYCVIKREATSAIGSANHFHFRQDYWDRLHVDKNARRVKLRAIYRRKLKFSLDTIIE